MPTPIGHTLGAYALLVALEPKFVATRERNSIALGTAFFFGTLADGDFLVAQLTTNPVLRHHFFSHSFSFTIVLTLAFFLILRLLKIQKAGWKAFLIGSAYFSHLFLDYFANDGSYPYGIPLLWPFTTTHFIAPIEFFYSIHRGEMSDLFSMHNLKAIGIEIGILGPLALLSVLYARKRLKTRVLK